MYNILLQGTADHHLPSCEYNLGGAAVATTVVETLRHFFPEARVASLVQFSSQFASKNNIRVIQSKNFLVRHYSFDESCKSNLLFLRVLLWVFFKKYLHLNLKFLIHDRRLEEYAKADLVVDISMDCFNADFGTLPVLDHCRDILLGRALSKPVIMYAQSPGPFNSWVARRAAAFALNRSSLITIREKASIDYLTKIGVVKPPVHLVSDPAFLFRPAPLEKVLNLVTQLKKNGKPLVAIVPPDGIVLNTQKSLRGYQNFVLSGFLMLRYFLPEKIFLRMTNLVKSNRWLSGFRSAKRENVCSNLAKAADNIVEKYSANVVLIPHVVMPDNYIEKDNDARTTVKEIYKLSSQKENVLPITELLTAEETKALIGQCDAVITSKMHAGIAATSQCIPAIVISGPHHKFKGIMGSLGLEEWVLYRFDPELISAAFQKLWSQREIIKANLKKRMLVIKAQSMSNGQLIKELIESGNSTRNS